MPSQKTVPVSERALTQRINRALKDKGKILKAARSPRVANEVGRHFVVRLTGKRNNLVAQRHVDVEALGRDLGVLSAWEHLEDSINAKEGQKPVTPKRAAPWKNPRRDQRASKV